LDFQLSKFACPGQVLVYKINFLFKLVGRPLAWALALAQWTSKNKKLLAWWQENLLVWGGWTALFFKSYLQVQCKLLAKVQHS